MNENIVPTNVNYSYTLMMDNLKELKKRYDFLNIIYIGKSVMGKEIPCVTIGNGPNQVFYSSSIHANEWINTVVMMKFIEEFSKAYQNKTKLNNYDVESIYDTSTIFIVPMCNPDGIDLVLENIPKNSARYIEARRIAKGYPDIPFPSGWKANIVGVDLNLQFPAGWNKAKEIKYAEGFTSPAPRDFVGFGPLTEPEALAIYNLTLSYDFRLILAYHTQGEIIYWKYLNYEPEDAEKIANKFADLSGYALEERADINSYAGFRDWFISSYYRPGFTIETGLGENPLPISQLDKIYNDNIGILLSAPTL